MKDSCKFIFNLLLYITYNLYASRGANLNDSFNIGSLHRKNVAVVDENRYVRHPDPTRDETGLVRARIRERKLSLHPSLSLPFLL